ncbi:MAG: pantoate--beta-alanine ligase [Bdellovibrionales bacterium]|nr:pantoate--beta-alanine ligase [Bdellovibrionales bacterium]
MEVVTTISEVRALVRQVKRSGRRVCLVPTMGALHAGHMSLVDVAREHAEFVLLYVFVNPTQFNSAADFETYPLTLEADIEACRTARVDAVFCPSATDIYPNGIETTKDRPRGCRVTAGDVSWPLEGEHRPGHFDGVTTVISLMFHITEPDCAVFGEKDFQQLKVIEQLVRDQHFAVEIIPAPLVRDDDGLALSSRNVRLSPEGRARALVLSQALSQAAERVAAGERRAGQLLEEARGVLSQPGVELEYVAIADSVTLQPLEMISGPCRMLVAANVDGVRLIDNMLLEP